MEKGGGQKQPWEMTYKEFLNEFTTIMASVGIKEVKGKLDPTHKSFEPLSTEEKLLLRKDWKEFSKKRGYSESDISEYERWLLICGRTTKLDGAISYPWRRNMHIVTLPPILYQEHVEWAQENGKHVPQAVLNDYEILQQITDNDFTVQVSEEETHATT